MGSLPDPVSQLGGTGGAGVQCNSTQFDCVSTYKVDAQIYWSMITSGAAGFLCLAAFCFLQTFVSIYKSRIWLPQVAIKPPFWYKRGVLRFFYWFWPTVSLSEKELLATAGLDALMFERLIVLSLQFFTPVTILSCAILIPIHSTQNFLDNQPQNGVAASNLMKLTMSNMPPSSSLLWLHFSLLWVYCFYGMWLLNHHYKWYMVLRQHYLTRGDSVQPWLRDGHGFGRNDAALSDQEEAVLLQGGGSALQSTVGMPEEVLTGTGTEGASVTGSPGQGAAGAGAPQQEVEMSRMQAPPGVEATDRSGWQSRAVSPDGSDSTSLPADSRRTSRQSSQTFLLGHHQASSSSYHIGGTTTTAAAAAAGGSSHMVENGRAGVSFVDKDNSPHHKASLGRFPSGVERQLSDYQRGLTFRRRHHWDSGHEEGSPRESSAAEEEAAVAAAVAGSAETMLGVGKPWWAQRYGDPLLDRHVVNVDITDDLAWDGNCSLAADLDTTKRLYRWWEIAPLPPGAPRLPKTLEPVPETRLLFDHRSLRARKPSVRFRNTLTAPGPAGTGVPLHVSTYAVLVTDVPEVDEIVAGGEEDFRDLEEGSSCSCLHKMLWSLPCMLRGRDLDTLACKWNSQVYRLSHKQQQQVSIRSFLHRRGSRSGGNLAALNSSSSGSKLHGSGTTYSPVTPKDTGRARAAASIGRMDSTSSSLGGEGNRGVLKLRLVEDTFKQLFKEDFHAVVPVHNFQPVDELLRQWNFDMLAYIQNRAIYELKCRKAAKKQARASEKGLQQQQQEPSGAPSLSDVAAQRSNVSRYSSAGSSFPGAISIDGNQISIGSAEAPRQVTAVTAAGSGSGGSTVSIRAGAAVGNAGTAAPETSFGASPADGGLQTARGSGVLAAAHLQRQQQVEQGTANGSQQQQQKLGRVPLPSLLLEQHGGSSGGAAGEVDEGPITPSRVGRPLRPQPVTCDMVQGCADEESGEGGGCGCCAACLAAWVKEKVPQEEALEAQRQGLVDLEASILCAQQEVLKGPCSDSFIVLFKTPQAATLAAHSSVFPQSGSKLDAFKVQSAPGPEEVLWQSLWKPAQVRREQTWRTAPWYLALLLVPTGAFTAALNSISYGLCNTSPEQLQVSMGWFCKTRFLQFLFTVVLPFVLLMLWQNMVIPQNLYKLELRRARAVSLSQMERNILMFYFTWEVINLFLGGVLSASFVSQIKILLDNPDDLPMLLGAAFPNSSNFFLNYVIARAFMMNCFRFIMPHGAMWRWIGQMLFTAFTSVGHAATERYRAFILYPASIRYGREPGLVLLILLIGVAYSIAAPLLMPFTMAYMCTAYVLWRYQMIYVCVRCYESGGLMWPLYFKIINWCMALFVVFTSSILLFKRANVQGALAYGLLPILFLFNKWCQKHYGDKVQSVPLWLAHEAPRTEIDPLVYTPPALRPHARGWYFEYGKAWVRWGVPPYA